MSGFPTRRSWPLREGRLWCLRGDERTAKARQSHRSSPLLRLNSEADRITLVVRQNCELGSIRVPANSGSATSLAVAGCESRGEKSPPSRLCQALRIATPNAHAGTSITVFLPDGNPEGVRLIFKSHWTGIAVASPRSRYPDVRLAREELRKPGVYALVGPADEASQEARIYVGEGEDPRARIDSHHANKDFWNRLVVFTSFGQALNKATIRYLESRLLQLAATAGRAELDNGNAPALPPLSEPDTADAESFLTDMLVIFPILGVNVFEPLQQTTSASRLHLSGPEAEGEGAETDDGFVVFAGALARAATVDSFKEWSKGWAGSQRVAGRVGCSRRSRGRREPASDNRLPVQVALCGSRHAAWPKREWPNRVEGLLR